MDCSLPGSSGILQARILEWVACTWYISVNVSISSEFLQNAGTTRLRSDPRHCWEVGSKPGNMRKQMRSTLCQWGKLELSPAGGLWDTVWNPPSIASPGSRDVCPLPALSSAEICSLEYLFMALWACPPRHSAWEECRLFWKDTKVCARTSTEQTPVGPLRVRTVRCYCFHVSYLISPTHFYLSSFKYNNW